MPEEKIYVIFKSPRQEFIFTDRALISVRGSSSIGTKKLTERLDYSEHHISNTRIQSPGLAGTDFDGELAFNLGSYSFGIDVRRDEWENVKPVYRTLIRLQQKQFRESTGLRVFQDILAKAWLQTNDSKSVKDLAFAASTEVVEKFYHISYADIWDQHGKDAWSIVICLIL